MQINTLTQALELFLLDVRARKLTPKTQKFYKEQIGWFAKHLADRGVCALSDVTSNHIKTYFVALHDRGLKSTSQHAAARAIKTFFNFCVRDEMLTKTPFAKVQMPKLEQRILPAFSDSELRKVLNTCETERDRAICRLMLDTGLRLSEVTALAVADVDASSGQVTVRNGKGQKDRIVYVGARTLKHLGRYLAYRSVTSDKLFLNLKNNAALTSTGLKQAIRRIGRAAGIGHCTAHTFRRTFALRSLKAGMNIYLLAKLMGHTDITVLKQYLALVEDDLREAQRKYGVVDNL